jgi:hypothetical protein
MESADPGILQVALLRAVSLYTPGFEKRTSRV